MNRRVVGTLHLALTVGLAGALGYTATRHHDTRAAVAAPPSFTAAPDVSLDGLVWDDFHGMKLPRSPADGPLHRDGELASGFTRTPRGALLAAIHIVVRAAPQWDAAVSGPTVEQQVVGPDQPQLAAGITADHRQADARPAAAIEGFRWLGYSPDAATVDVVSAGPGDDDLTVRAATRIALLWRDGDWRVLAPPGGDWGRSAAPLASADGFTAFPGRG